MCVTWLWLVHIELIKAKLRRFCKVRCTLVNISELKKGESDGNEKAKKVTGFVCWNNNFASRFFFTFLSRHFTTKTWKCLISRLSWTETQDKTSFFFSWTLIQSFRIQLQKKDCQHLTKKAGWNKRDKVWGSRNSPFLSDVFVAVTAVNARASYYHDTEFYLVP